MVSKIKEFVIQKGDEFAREWDKLYKYGQIETRICRKFSLTYSQVYTIKKKLDLSSDENW